jgi:hypothetical protein
MVWPGQGLAAREDGFYFGQPQSVPGAGEELLVALELHGAAHVRDAALGDLVP